MSPGGRCEIEEGEDGVAGAAVVVFEKVQRTNRVYVDLRRGEGATGEGATGEREGAKKRASLVWVTVVRLYTLCYTRCKMSKVF